MVEVHTVELTKYNLQEATIREASKIEQWAFFLLYADQYDPERLRDLLPGVEFDQAITVIETISQKTEDRTMYDQREKALRDHQWVVEGARQEGLEKGQAIGTIATLQGIVGETTTDVDELKKLDEAELNRLCADLQERLRSRGSLIKKSSMDWTMLKKEAVAGSPAATGTRPTAQPTAAEPG